MSGQEETDITDYFIKSAFPTHTEVQKVLNALEKEPEGLSDKGIARVVNIKCKRIEKTTKLLSLESPAPIAKQGKKWQLTPTTLSDTFWERAERLTKLRREEQAQMQEYVRLTSGHMPFLIRALNGEQGSLSPSDLPLLSTEPDSVLVQEAIAFLRRTSLPIEPRKHWPSGRLQHCDLS